LVHSKARQHLIHRLLSHKSIKRIAGFQSSAFAAFAPKMYKFYAVTLGKLFNHHHTLQHNFRNSIFPAVSFNLGPATVALDHLDYGNFSSGMCALTALGSYNPQKSAHFILFPFRIVTEFPPGSTIIIPSACLNHGNTPIQNGETRMSIAQYAAGGLFRYVEYGFTTVKSLLSTAAGKARRVQIDMEAGERWKMGIDLFSKYSELATDVAEVYR
ncbi:hypothetical protein HYPSUDRAFT_134501, partial [Hypholoma sublateritium FD-334 SS-4]